MFQRILVPTDGSRLSTEAAEAAIGFAKACGCELVALAIAQPEPVLLTAEGALATDGVAQFDVLLEQARRDAERVAAAAARAGVACKAEAGYGYSPADAIVEAAQRHGCDLVFMASHGRRGLSRLIAGSVTQRVLAYATVPVMVYRARPEQAQARAPGAR
jgi:nucleotide-binding universal stress UspA family protein